MADHGARQRHQAVGDAADVHQVGGQQEERHRQQDERVVGVEGLLHQLHRVEPRLDDQDRQAGEAERERHRHAQDHQDEERRRTGSSAAIAGGQHARRVMRAPRRAGCRRFVAESARRGTRSRSRPVDRPGDVDQPQRQLGELGDAVPGEARELVARPHEHQREASTPRRATRRSAASPRRDRRGHMSTSKCVALAHADHRADHDHPDEQEARHLLGPDVGRDQLGVAREDLHASPG